MRPRGIIVFTSLVIATVSGIYPVAAKAWVDYFAKLVNAVLDRIGDMPMVSDDNRIIILLLVAILIAIAVSSKGK